MKHATMTLFLAILVIGVSGCGSSGPEKMPSESPRVKVQVYRVEERAELATEQMPGSVRAKLRASIEAKISGTIEKMPVSEGQSVQEGQLLAELDVQEIRSKLEQATAMHEQAQRDLSRFAALRKQQALTQQEYEGMQAKATVARAAAEEAQTMLGYAKVTAPFNGIITRKLSNVGDLASPGRPLFEIEDPATLRFEASVPESLIARITPGIQVPVLISGQNIAGTVAEVSPTADPNSRTFLVKFDLGPVSGIRSGQFGHVRVPSGNAKSILIPATAVQQRGQMEIVFVIRDGRAWLRLVRSGRQLPGQVELVAGLDEGEHIAAAIPVDLRDGTSVEVMP